MSAEALEFLHQAQKKLELSVRGFENTRRLSSTIAHLDGDRSISERHMAEALQYRLESHSHVLA